MITRRRMITIMAGAALLPSLAGAASVDVRSWKGIALGANAKIILDHPNADALIGKAQSEISRLEKIFSLYTQNSELSRLNANGSLQTPSFEFLELMGIAKQIHSDTQGAFDPTVQPLWALYAEHGALGNLPTEAEVFEARLRTGLHNVSYSAGEIAFEKSGMALTFNGIAQGYIADKVADLLRREGVQNVMVNTGEISTLGLSPTGRAWNVELASNGEVIELSNASIATSAPSGTSFDQAESVGHILDPRTGSPAQLWQSLSVIHRSAARADGLSTGFCLMQRNQIEAVSGSQRVIFGDAISA